MKIFHFKNQGTELEFTVAHMPHQRCQAIGVIPARRQAGLPEPFLRSFIAERPE